MKKFKKLLSLGVVAGMITLTATGCGKMTVEKLNEKMKEAAAQKQMTYAGISLDLEASYEMDIMGANMSMPFNMALDLNQSANADPYAGYTEGHIKAELLGQEIDSDIKVHTVVEEDKIINYNYTGMTDSWTREDTGLSSADYEEFMVKAPKIDASPEEMTLEEETVTLDGQEVYVLHLNFTGDDIESILSETGALGDMMDISEGSMSEITIPSITYIDAKTFLPVQIEMTIEGIDQYINQMLTEEMEATGITEEDASVSVEVTKCQLNMKNLKYDVQNIPEVPQEVFDELTFAEALAVAGDTLTDGRYLIKYGNSAAAISVFEDFTLNSLADGQAEFYSNDGMKMVSLAAMPANMAEQLISESISEYETLFANMGMTLEAALEPETVTTHLGDVEVNGMGSVGVKIYYTAIPVDGMDLFVMALDLVGEWQQAADIIVPMCDAISEVTLEDLQQGENL